MREAGAPDALIDEVVARDNASPAIQPANDIVIRLFFACATQWNHAGMAGTRTGLNYTAVAVRAESMANYKALDDDDREYVWDGLQRMEAAALEMWKS